MPKDAYKYFRIEARELLDELGQGVLALERGARAREAVPALLRFAHTLKGAARVVRQAAVADAAHRIEDVLVPWRDEAGVVPHDAVAAVLAGLADIEAQLAALPSAEGAAAPAAAAAVPRADEPARSVRAEIAEMDALLAGLERTHGHVARLRQGRADLAAARGLVRSLRAPAREAGRATGGAALAEALQAAVARLDDVVDGSADRLERELRQLRERTERLRLVPAQTLFARLERSARDVADAQGKQVVFEGAGGALRLDASTLDAVQGALVQMVRNAVAHGIEAPEVRLAAGKPRVGRVAVEVLRRGRGVVLRCVDDGAGIDLEAVRRSAERRGRLDPAAAADADADALLELLLQGGLSTSGTVTEVAGRGVGLDVAREAAQRLGGTLRARTAAGAGTTLELAVPLPLAALDVLMVEAGPAVAGVPLESLVRALRVGAGDIVRSGTRETVLHDGRAVPYVALARLLADGDAAPPPRERVSVLVLAHGGRQAALGVDRLGEVASVLSRPLPELAPPCALAAGVATDIDGTPRLVLDVGALVHAAAQAQAPAVAPPAPPAPVLVVDDSLTTRMLETSILESAGYVVDAAASAEEGLERAKRRRYALFLVDVEMPGMDGFSFVERTRADPALRDVPAMLVSSRASLADRQRGAAAGAAGYIVKGEFAQDEFLARVRQLVESAA
jgi:two-component system chemotaxis sensor kinase CheA